VTAPIASALERLSPRERRLAGAAVLALAAAAGLAGLGFVREDLATLRARVAGRERELAEVRRLAAALGREAGSGPSAPGDAVLLTRLEAAAETAVGRERIASMTPGEGGEHVALRVTGASLPEVVRLLHALETGPPPLVVGRLELRKHPDDPARFDAVLEVGP
jgi:hypothetical protein